MPNPYKWSVNDIAGLRIGDVVGRYGKYYIVTNYNVDLGGYIMYFDVVRLAKQTWFWPFQMVRRIYDHELDRGWWKVDPSEYRNL